MILYCVDLIRILCNRQTVTGCCALSVFVCLSVLNTLSADIVNGLPLEWLANAEIGFLYFKVGCCLVGQFKKKNL